MGTYKYKARDKFGKLVEGVMASDSEGAVALKLKQMSYVPVVIQEAKENSGMGKFFDRFRSVKFCDVNMFTRQFYALQRAGLPLLSSLNALREQASNKILKEVIVQIARDIEAGLSLSVAMEKHPKIFNALYVNMIKSGEASGRLDEILERLAVLGEHEEVIQMRIKSALRYPVIVVIAIVVGFLVLTTLVVPRFAKIYNQFSANLPLPTQIMLAINYAVTKLWWLILILIGIAFFWINKFIDTKQGRFFWDSLKLKIPVFGPLILKMVMSRFSRITGTLMHSGIPIIQILELVSGGLGNAIVARTIDNIKTSVSEGKGMLEPIKISGMFPAVVVQMVSVGEETGKLDELLLHVSDYYDSQIDYTINNLISLIEPILILVLGCAVLFMALSVFLPMWNLMGLFRK